MSRRTHAYAVALAAGALLASAACSPPHESDASSKAAAGHRTVRPVEGCGTKAWTDPKDLSPNRTPACCRPGAPPPQPLSEPRELTIATGTLSAEYVAPLQVALDKGKFKKEGLDVELKVLPTPDALPLLAKGDIDALWARVRATSPWRAAGWAR